MSYHGNHAFTHSQNKFFRDGIVFGMHEIPMKKLSPMKNCFVDSRLWCLTVSLLLSHLYPGSGVVLDCIDS